MKDAIGNTFGRLKVESVYLDEKRMYRTRCRCNCGSICFPQYSALVSGATKSCGCLRREVTSKNRTRHGASKDSGRWAEYGIWAAIKTRCTNSSSKAYKHYGGRGITICKRWSDSFLNFVADMGRRPNKYSQIDRVDNNLGYFPENCVWTSAKINVRHRRNTKMLTVKGVNKPVAEWAEEIGVKYTTLNSRILRGTQSEEKLMAPTNR